MSDSDQNSDDDLLSSNPNSHTVLLNPLRRAIHQGDIVAVERLLPEVSHIINELNCDQETVLYTAAKLGHLDIVQRILQIDGITINSVTYSNEPFITPLLVAIKNGHLLVAHQLLANPKIDPNLLGFRWYEQKRTRQAICPLGLALFCDHISLVFSLLNCPSIDVNALEITDGDWEFKFSALHTMASAPKSSNGLAMYHMLLAAVPNPKLGLAARFEGRSVLHTAAIHGRDDIFQELLKFHGSIFSINELSDDGLTALDLVYAYGSMEAIQRMLAIPGILHAPGKGSTVLELAVWSRNCDGIRAMIQSPGGFDEINVKFPFDITYFHWKLLDQRYADIFIALCDHPKVPIHARYGQDAETPLGIASVLDRPAVVKRILQVPGIKVDLPSLSGRTPLLCAARHNHPESLQLLLEVSDLTLKTKKGDSVLHMAIASEKHSPLLVMIIDKFIETIHLYV